MGSDFDAIRDELLERLAPYGIVDAQPLEEPMQDDEAMPAHEFVEKYGLEALVHRVLEECAEFLFADDDVRQRPLYYLLDDNGEPVPTTDQRAANDLLCHAKARKIAETNFVFRGLPVEVSTVFLVLDHNHAMQGPPILWESMVFTRSPRLDGIQMRYTNVEEALSGHQWIAEHCRNYLRLHHPLSNRRARVALRREQRGISVFGGKR